MKCTLKREKGVSTHINVVFDNFGTNTNLSKKIPDVLKYTKMMYTYAHICLSLCAVFAVREQSENLNEYKSAYIMSYGWLEIYVLCVALSTNDIFYLS